MERFEHIIVDGYNIMNGWSCLKKMIDKSLGFRRSCLIATLQDFSDYVDKYVSIVFDGSDKKELIENNGKLRIIFSKKTEAADTVIERLVYKDKGKNKILVVTDDKLEQNMVFGFGASFINSKDFEKIILSAVSDLEDNFRQRG
ncbi:MAG: NYN domain-containing protein [Candidatus Omnitrophica bacterium]|nr:NYN domain-containing protein [Candidatus Omnitrophota bacterium]